MIFDIIFEKTMAHEGGYVDHPDDQGGETYKGIARKRNKDWIGWLTIDDLKHRSGVRYLDRSELLQTQVRDFYFIRYWQRLKCSQMISEVVAAKMFDVAVNMGRSRAGTFLQIVLNAFNNRGTLYNDIAEDGIVGPVTIDTLAKCLKAVPEQVVWTALHCLEGAHRIDIMKRNESQEVFALGWFKRMGVYGDTDQA